jgi:RNA polymerase sigma factor (sigma-70 family)
MDVLVDMVRTYRDTDDLAQRLRLAEAIVGAVGPALRQYVESHSPTAWVEDIFQDTLAALAQSLHRFCGKSDAQFWNWCYHVARNRRNDRLRRRETDPLAHTDPDTLWASLETAAQDQPLPAGERLDLEYALDLLRKSKPPCYDYLWTHYVLGWELAEVACGYGLSYDAARMQIRRCLELAQSLMARTP